MNISEGTLIAIIGLIGTFTTLLVGGIGYLVKSYLERKQEQYSKNNDVKREMYKKFVSLIVDLFANSSAKKSTGDNTMMAVLKLYDFYKDYYLYSSPEVINNFGEFMQYLYKHPENMEPKIIFQKLSTVIRSMRKELGLSNKGLGNYGENIFKALLTDFDKIL